ncbi:MAG: hypothetical protein KatS3mg012_1639 [Gaiellaceae bacterium]|nr:MAG: hypothetical protein KatS3mg012_1639 [Gaiellaceae bacterium]
MDGPDIIVSSLSVPQPRGPSKTPWQYHSRSDLHSKVACWAVLFDLLQHSALMRSHARSGKIVFGINHELRDFATARKKVLDLVVARPSGPTTKETLADLARRYRVVLDSAQAARLATLPELRRAPVGAVLMALEAKAAMTEHVKALPRLYDELNSSHQTIHGASRQALAVGLVMINAASTFVSPDLNKVPGAEVVLSKHSQPAAAAAVVAKVREIPRRTASATEGYDGLGIIVISAINDGTTPVSLVTAPPAPPPGDIFYYDNMITRVANEYDTTFKSI